MKDMMSIVSAVILLLACCLMLVSCSNSKSSNNRVAASTPSQSNQATQSSGDLQANQKQPGQQAGPELERQREQAEREARKELDQDAKTAIEQTHKAVQAISENKTEEALSNIEQATGKINILLARNPSTALIPVDLAVNVIDTAPQNKTMILEIAQDASRAFDDKNYPTARALLYMLISE